MNPLSCGRVTLLKFLCKFGACQKLEQAGRMGDFGNWSWIEWMQFVLKNCELLHFVRGLYDKNSAS